MICYIYRCSRKEDMYLYLAGKDDFSPVPATILKSIGSAELVMELDIIPETRLAREDAGVVLENIEEKGFHLQLPSNESVEAIMARIAGNNDA